MSTSRRSFFALIAAALGARKLPAAPLPVSGVAIQRTQQRVEAKYFPSVNAANWAAMRPSAPQFYCAPYFPAMVQIWPRPKIGETITVRRPDRYRI